MSAASSRAAPIVMVHGFGESAASWSALANRIGPDLAAHTWELPGHGRRRDDPAASCQMDVAIAELEALIGSLEQPPILLGHSAGGYLALRCAARAKVPLAGLVVIASGPGFRNADAMQSWNATVDKLAARADLPPHVASVAYMSDSLVLERLPAITVPTLLVVGGDDRPVYQRGADFVMQRLPGARLVCIDGAGHDLHITHADALAGHLREFAGAAATLPD